MESSALLYIYWLYLYKVYTRHLNIKCFESEVPAIFLAYAPTFFIDDKRHTNKQTTWPRLVSSQPIPWRTRIQVNQYPLSPVVPGIDKSSRNQSFRHELTHALHGKRSTGTLGKEQQPRTAKLALSISKKVENESLLIYVCGYDVIFWPVLASWRHKYRLRLLSWI